MPIPANILEILACPHCRAKVRELPDGRGVACLGCRREYPFTEGILSMLPESGKVPGA